ncbi:MAG: 7TM diverse intracellular signaling domain-containing protein, partial [Chitinophagaceae bacterium]
MKFTNTGRTVCICLSLCGIALTAIARNELKDSIAIITATDRPEQVIQHIDFSSLHFAKATDNRVNFGMAGNDYKYIVLKINTPINREDLFLSIYNTSLDTVAVYRLENNLTGKLVYRAGLLIPYDPKNKYVWHTMPVEVNNFPSYYLIAMKAAEKNINVHYELLSSDELQEKYFHHAQIVYFYIGVVSLIITTILLAFFVFRRKVLAAYLGYIVCTFTWILSHYGYLFPYMYPRLPMINAIIRPVSSIGACYFLLLVMSLVFAQQLQALKKILKFTRMMLYILPVSIISMLLFSIKGLPYIIEDALLIIWHLALIFSLCLIAITPINFIRSGATAKIFSTAMFVICTMTVVQLFDNSGIINNYFIEEHGITLGSLLENIILAFGLFYNLLQERKQHEEQVLALEMEQAETLKKLITVQDNERKRIAGDLHDNIGPLLAALKINFNRIINSKKGASGLVQKTE